MRYEKLYAARAVSDEAVALKRQEWRVAQAAVAAAQANLEASRQDLALLRSEREGLTRQRASLRLLSPIDGLVTRRDADPGTTVIAGQSVVEVVEPGRLWVNVRFDQQRALGLRAELPASIVLRSRADARLAGRIARVEPQADAVTEETLAKVEFTRLPQALPPIGELAEVTVALATRPAMPVGAALPQIRAARTRRRPARLRGRGADLRAGQRADYPRGAQGRPGGGHR